MPPYVPRKRLQSPDDDARPAKRSTRATAVEKTPKPKASEVKNPRTRTPKAKVPARKSTLWDDLDSSASKRGSTAKTRAAIRKMQEDEDEDDSPLTSPSDLQIEDSPAPKRQKISHEVANSEDENEDDDDDDDEDEDIEFEDVPSHQQQQTQPEQEQEPDPELGDIEFTLHRDIHRVLPLSSEIGKTGPSKKTRAIRIATHCVHVQLLLWHNALRNSWLCDQEVQAIMVSHLPPRLWTQVERFRRSCGLKARENASETPKGKGKGKGKGKEKESRRSTRATKDWSEAADRLEEGVPDLSHGDPAIALMSHLASWWQYKFRVTAPGLRKWGYMDVRRLANLRTNFEKGEHDPEKFGERIVDIEQFRQLAQSCTGSRDVGAQLFTALLRGLGLDARMVASLQPVGFGWSKAEEADEEKKQDEESKEPEDKKADDEPAKKSRVAKKKAPAKKPARRKTRRSDKDALMIDIDDSDEYLTPQSDSESDTSLAYEDDDFAPPKNSKFRVYNKELEFPHYWTEVLTPVTHKYLPVDPLKGLVCTNRESIERLEPRGGRADKAKQVMAYCIGFSQDGTAKDVTVRYLKKQIYPGKTKGFRIPEEKVPIYNKHGKVRRYEHFDWFKSVMRGYARGDQKRPITEADEMEDSTDLKPKKPEKKEVKEGEETLQYYKTSAEFVLRRHLKREEALPPTAVPVKKFRNKVKGGKFEEEDVYLRKDIALVKSAETWHKQGRAPLPGVEPLKHAPYRAATTNRRRELAHAEALTGQKVLQPLYSFSQTEWIIPDPIKDGVIPKNEYGNIDMFAEHMCPEGAVHVPYRGTVRICKRLQIDYAEAVVGFEFGHRMAVPVIQGVVIAEENHERLMEELEKDEAERARKEDEKRRKAALSLWRKFLVGLRVTMRIQHAYSHLDVPVDVPEDLKESNAEPQDEEMGGGFLPDGYEDEEEDVEEDKPSQPQTSAFFASGKADGEEDDDEGEDPFQVEYHQEKVMDVEAGKAEIPDSDVEMDSDSEPELEPGPKPETETESESDSEGIPVRRKAIPKKATPKKATPQKATPKKATPKKVTPKKPVPKAKPQQPLRRSTRRTRQTVIEASDEDEDEDEEDEFPEPDDEDDDDY